ncbi:MAG: hypothetical protein U5L09_04970 [Bacteroidales bacterium]|nr:hypothetical protein [Bacteroidales bacterium]
MDADDRMLPSRLALQKSFLDQYPDFGAVGGKVQYVAHHPKTEGFSKYVDWSNRRTSYEDIMKHRFVELPLVNPTAMWRRKVSEKLGAYQQGDFPEDYEMWLRWLGQGVKVGKVNETVLYWHDSYERLTRSDPRYSKEAFHRVRVKYLADYLAKNNPFHPAVWVWGAARQTRRMAEMMEPRGIRIEKYIDVNTKAAIGKEVIHYSKIPPREAALFWFM